MADLLNEVVRSLTRARDDRQVGLIRRSVPFSLSKEATEHVTRVMCEARRHPRQVVAMLELSRLPSEYVWLEWDNHAMAREQARVFGEPEPDLSEVPARRGLTLRDLGDHWSMTHVADTVDAGIVSCPFVVNVSPEGDAPPGRTRMRASGLSEAQLAMVDQLEADDRTRELVWSVSLDILGKRRRAATLSLGPRVAQRLSQGSMWQLLESASQDLQGIVRIATGILAMVNSVPIRLLPHRPVGRMLTSQGSRPYMTNRTVEIDLDGRSVHRQIRSLLSAAHARHRAHMVRGHWRVHLGADQPGPRWRWMHSARRGRACWHLWIEPHQRGDATLGWVRQEYEVVS